MFTFDWKLILGLKTENFLTIHKPQNFIWGLRYQKQGGREKGGKSSARLRILCEAHVKSFAMQITCNVPLLPLLAHSYADMNFVYLTTKILVNKKVDVGGGTMICHTDLLKSFFSLTLQVPVSCQSQKYKKFKNHILLNL